MLLSQSQTARDFLTLTACSPGLWHLRHVLVEMKVGTGSQEVTTTQQHVLARQPWDLNHFRDPYALARCGSPCLVLLVTGMKDRRGRHQASWRLLATKQFTKDLAKPQCLQFWCSFWNRVFLKQSVGRHRNNPLCLKNYLGKICVFLKHKDLHSFVVNTLRMI